MIRAGTIFLNAIDQIVIDADRSILEVNVLPPQTQYFANATASTEHYCKQWIPSAILLTVGDVIGEGFLFRNGKRMTLFLFPTMAFLDFGHNSLRRIQPQQSITDSHCKGRMQQSIHDLHAVRLKALFHDQGVVELLHIRIFDLADAPFPEIDTDIVVVHILVVGQGGLLQVVLLGNVLVKQFVQRNALCTVGVKTILDCSANFDLFFS